jgi:hypothetical protein
MPASARLVKRKSALKGAEREQLDHAAFPRRSADPLVCDASERLADETRRGERT